MPNNIEIKNIQVRSEEVQDILTSIPTWMIRWGSLLMLSIIMLLLMISWMVKYPDLISAQATITTKIPPQKEYAKVSGKLTHLLVEDNQVVEKGQPLALLENMANHNHVFYLKAILDTLEIKSNDFDIGLEKLPLLNLGEIESEYANFQNSYIKFKINKEFKPFKNQLYSNNITLLEQKNRLDILLNQEEIEKSELKYIEKDVERYQNLFTKDVISEQEFEKKQMDFLKARRNLKNLTISISQTKQAIALARKDFNSTDITGIQENMMLLKFLTQSINQLKNAIESWEYKYLVTSNIDGTVSFMNYWDKNHSVSKDELLFNITPKQNSDYIAKLITPPENSGKIEIGQNVNIVLASYPETEFGILKGVVSEISSYPNDDGQYLIDVSIQKELKTTYDKKLKFKPEMIGTANIITEDLRLLERILYQLKNILKSDHV